MSIDLLSLPDIELIGYLLKSDDGGQKMKGVIRPISSNRIVLPVVINSSICLSLAMPAVPVRPCLKS